MLLSRRAVLLWAAGGPETVRHILPTASHDRFRIKVSFFTPQLRPPVLRVGGKRVMGERTDVAGENWVFNAGGLKAATTYELQLFKDTPWPLRTLPHPEENVSRFRLMVYTCAGGHDGVTADGKPYWVSIANRRRLLAAGLAQKPDAVLAIGDQVYWDLRFGRASGATAMGISEWARREVGEFRRDLPVRDNEAVLKRAAGPQIDDLYGTMFRSVPTFFVQDDHDYFENDEAIPPGREPHGVSLPPDDFMLQLARSTQALYFPEFLTSPVGLSGSGESYGTLRFGRAAELLVYDCRRYLSLTGSYAGFISSGAEAWLMARMKDSNARHVVNVPSTPIGWSAGKWGEWYPDLLGNDGKLSTTVPKYMWQDGWKLQHDRLLRAASAMTRGVPLFLSGDLHALAHGAIERNGADDFRRNPVHTVLTGPVSTGPRGWPSAARGTPPRVATGIGIKETLAPLEMNGFTIVDFLPERVECSMYRWKMGRAESELDGLQPFHRFTIP
jgi:phosphodiesterase/alkaline phosphatase D-like protein